MAVADLMTKKLITVSLNETVENMQKIFAKYPIHHLLVLNKNQLAGIIDDRDLLKITSPYLNTKLESKKDLFTLTRQAHQLMHPNPATINSSASIQDAARSLIENNVGLLPVVDKGNVAIGVLSWKDVMRFIMN